MRVPIESYQNIRNPGGYLILPKEFTCKDGKFTQIRRENNLALYQRDSHFEVIFIQSQNSFEITKGVFTEKKEGWPSDNLWGQLGWSYQDLESAEKKFNQLLNPETKTAPQTIDNNNIPIKRKRGRPRKIPLT